MSTTVGATFPTASSARTIKTEIANAWTEPRTLSVIGRVSLGSLAGSLSAGLQQCVSRLPGLRLPNSGGGSDERGHGDQADRRSHREQQRLERTDDVLQRRPSLEHRATPRASGLHLTKLRAMLTAVGASEWSKRMVVTPREGAYERVPLSPRATGR